MKEKSTVDISFVAPIYNEAENVEELHKRIHEAGMGLGKSFEIIFVDDGSTDDTVERAQKLKDLVLIVFRRNFGQTAAMDAGIKAARGEIIITLDGDLQNDPKDTQKLLDKMEEGYDVVSGWRFDRKDPFMKRFVSRGADKLRKILLKDSIHDSGCSLKAYKRECFESVDLFGEMHRFIPAILEMDGWRVGEAKVTHHPRTAGVTKYNWRRTIKGFIDMIAIWFLRRYSARPLHFFGGTGILMALVGSGILLVMVITKVMGASLAERIWPLIGIFLVLAGIQFFVFGFLADILLKNNYSARGRMNYNIKKVIKS